MKNEFKQDMGKNPLGSGQELKQLGKYIVEFYNDSFTIARDKVVPRLQIWRKAKENENHWRKWKDIGDFEDFDGDLREKFENITIEEIEDMDG